MKTAMRCVLGLVITALLVGASSAAAPPELIPCQGRILDGTNLVTGSVALELRLYDSPTNGILHYADSNTVLVADGLYSTFLGDDTVYGSLTNAMWLDEVYLEIEADGTILLPRQRLASAPYALVGGAVPAGSIGPAELAEGAVGAQALSADGTVAGDLLLSDGTNVQWVTPGEAGVPDGHSLDASDAEPTDVVFVDAEGNVGVGTTQPVAQTAFHIAENAPTRIPGTGPYAQLVISGEGNQNAQLRMRFGTSLVPGMPHQASVETSEWSEGGETNFSLALNRELWVTGKGDVGIGLATPQDHTKLHVAMDTDFFILGTPPYAQLTLSGTTDPDRQLRVGFDNRDTPLTGGRHGFLDAGKWVSGGNVKYPLDLNNAVWIASDGDVGIATREPEARLEVEYDGGAGKPGILVQGPDYSTIDLDCTGGEGETWRLQSADDGAFTIWKLVGERAMTITSGRRVGFGVSNPTAQLTVQANDAGLNPLRVFNAAGATCLHVWDNEGVSIGSGTEVPPDEGLYVKGVLRLDGGSDIAEPFSMDETADIPAGSVVVIDPERAGVLKIAERPYDRCVAGVVSGAGGVKPGLTLTQPDKFDGDRQVALAGRVYTLCDASHGAIRPGDLLTTSATPGHAMRVSNHALAQGAILGKAMSSLEEGKGLVLILVTLQ